MASLLSQIQSEALDDQVSITSALRKCLVLGGESGSAQLREWASRELEGYGPEDALPEYRVIRAPLTVDGIAGNHQITGQQIAPSMIPDFAQEFVSERIELRYGVGTLESMLELADIKLQPPGASDLARYMNMAHGTQIVSLYWRVAHTEIHGVLDRIRTALTQLVVELRMNMGDADALPTAETANQAVNVVISGERSTVQISSAQTSGDQSPATVTATLHNQEISSLLEELEVLLRGEGDGETAEKVAHLATLATSASPDKTKVERLWAAIKVAATTNEAVALIARIAPLLATVLHHH